MRAASAVAFVCLALSSTPCLAQSAPPSGEEPPLTVETIGLEPTVGKTGDVVKAAFRVRFPDLVRDGKEVLVLEDRMAADKLPLAPFEAVGLDVEKRDVGDEHVWDYVYRLRIVGVKKDLVAVPSVTFYWIVRDIGQPIEDAEVRQTATQPLQFRYVSSLTEEAVLKLRDEIELGRFSGRATFFRLISWIVAPLPLTIWAVTALLAWRRPRREPVVKRPLLEETEPEPILEESPSLRQARRQLRQQLQALQNGHNGSVPESPARLALALREYLIAELPAINPGDTARDIRRHVQTKVADGPRKETLDALADRLVAYQDALERGTADATIDPHQEENLIESLLGQLNARARFIERAKRVIGRS